MNFALEQLGIGHDKLLAGERTKPGRLEPDALNRARALVVADGVTLFEWLVEEDREGCKKIGKDALCRKANGDSADAQTRDERCDVHSQIVEDQDAGYPKQ